MGISIGIDIVDVKDFAKKIRMTKSLQERLFTDFEIEYCKKKGIEHLASRFAAKEAFAKACSIKNISWHDVEVRNLPSGKPILKINEKTRKKVKIKNIDLSISNIKEFAVAAVILQQ